MVVNCQRKGRRVWIRVIRGARYECTLCGIRWPIAQGSKHPEAKP